MQHKLLVGLVGSLPQKAKLSFWTTATAHSWCMNSVKSSPRPMMDKFAEVLDGVGVEDDGEQSSAPTFSCARNARIRQFLDVHSNANVSNNMYLAPKWQNKINIQGKAS